MKLSIHKLKEVLKSNKGELIIETIISYTVLVILFFSVSTAIMNSFKIANSSIVRANRMQQENINPAVLDDYANEVDGVITFVFNGNTATHNIRFNYDGMIAFSPEV